MSDILTSRDSSQQTIGVIYIYHYSVRLDFYMKKERKKEQDCVCQTEIGLSRQSR